MTIPASPPTSAAQAAREILRRLNDVIGANTGPQAKLNQTVQLIGEALNSEVCSIYLLRDGVLELYATRGLNQSAVHVTKLGLGEGLVGTIAADIEILNLAEAASHPDYAYRPETGEEQFRSFAGVPIIRRERAVGVLCVQHAASRGYDDIEIEALQTVALVLSELIANADLIDGHSSVGPAIDQSPQTLSGLKLVEGMARGAVVFHQPRVVIEHTVADDIEVERARVYSAFTKMREQIDRMASQAEFGGGGEHDEVLAMYKMFAYDEGWSRRINEAIDSGLTAEAAIERVQQRTRMRMRQIDDPLLRDRMHDLDSILIARNLGPAELLEYDRRRLKGVVLEEGSLTAHVIIVARAMGIPVLGRVRDIRRMISEGDTLLLDVGRSVVHVRPSAATMEAFEARFGETQKRRERIANMRDVVPETKDGVRIDLMINAGLREDVAAIDLTGADGIGLFRTEFQFLVSATLPQRDRQQRLYRDVLDGAGKRPVTFRTVDIGGDKALPYMRQDTQEEENPAMGWRALRLALEREGLMKVQARALLEAAAGRTLNVMFPLVSEPWEFEAAREIFVSQRAYLLQRGKKLPRAIRYGVMLEVPALAEMLDLLLPHLDFLSIGTNDLTQFLFAADRADPRLAERYDWLSPAVLRFVQRVIRQCDAARVPVGVCGEMGGRPLEAMALIGLGLRRLSITPAGVGPVKAMIRTLDSGAIAPFVEDLVASGTRDMRKRLELWASEQGVDISA
ncbi:MAG: PEP-utilizing enzyme [Sphingopyxis sp.]|nr:PEP-utilizing enzyme [Sphingopyxis sp.]